MRRGVMVPEHMGNPSRGDGGVALISATEIAKRLNVSQMHVSRLLSSSLEKLREGIGRTESEIR